LRDKTPTSKRPKITHLQRIAAVEVLKQRLIERLQEKGYGTMASRHEVLGMMVEEYDELIEAVRSDSLAEVRAELLDIAVGAVFSLACIDAGLLEW
jgi:NTP pyrophosphatase (non-canonical NTP hydrolase)